MSQPLFWASGTFGPAVYALGSRGEVEAVRECRCDELDTELARLEDMADGDELRRVLAQFYPELRGEDAVTVFYFRLVEAMHYERPG